VFLHAVNEGPANQSYGLQVAQLAGVPAPVIRAARKHLAYLEQQSASQHTPQLDLFSAPPVVADDLECADAPALPDTPHPALEKLRDIDPDDLKPRDALDLLYELRTLVRSHDADGHA